MFIAALFIIAKTDKQPKCPTIDEYKKKIWHIYTGILLSYKKEWNNAICSKMDRPRDYHTKWSQKEKDKYCMIITYVWNIKYDTNKLYETETYQYREQTYGCQRGEGMREGWTESLGLADENYYM